jgi:formate dehydrogenase iron-sulfur subunit
MCSTKALLAGDSDEISRVYLTRVISKGKRLPDAPPIWEKVYGDR